MKKEKGAYPAGVDGSDANFDAVSHNEIRGCETELILPISVLGDDADGLPAWMLILQSLVVQARYRHEGRLAGATHPFLSAPGIIMLMA